MGLDSRAYERPEPFEHGMLPVGGGQEIYYEISGNPEGKPAVTLHGGPGSGHSANTRRLFDPVAYCLVQFDQRGCGASTPSVASPSTSLTRNTTEHLLADIEVLREHLGIEQWLVWGASWGVTLALAYAERFPERVTEMVLASVTMTRPADVHWLYHEVGRYFPEEWDRFAAGAGYADDLVAAYDQLLNHSGNTGVAGRAAASWCAWEDAVVSLEPGWSPHPRYRDPRFRMTFARLCAHYFAHAGFIEDGRLLAEAHRLRGIPGVMVHGRLDLGGPADVPWLLARAWPGSELHYVGTGHAGGPTMTERMLDALDAFATRM